MAYFNKYVLLFLIKIVHKKLFEIFQDEKELFLNYKKFDLFTSEKCIFPKGLTHNFGQKVKFFFNPYFSAKLFNKKLFENFRDKKKLFLTYKKFDLFSTKKSIFPKRSTHDFRKKFKIFSALIFH